jgi:sigma-B regulation protein RsbU (phosphoserine phosphatase)
MSVFRTLVRYGLGNMVEQQHSEQSLAKVVSLVNDYMVANHGDTLMFATMFIARFCPSSGRLSYVSAGHEAPLLRRGSQCQRLDAPGPAMGLFPGAVYELGHVQLEPGDALVVFSDGIIDARSPADESFTLDRLEDLLLTMAEHLTADQIADEIRSRVKAHMNGASQFDDMTLMVMRVVPT